MIIYRVSVAVDQAVVESWQSWMQEIHIPDVLRTGHFVRHRFCRVTDPTEESQRVQFRIDYECDGIEPLERYQANAAGPLQREHSQKFEGRFAAQREVLEIISS